MLNKQLRKKIRGDPPGLEIGRCLMNFTTLGLGMLQNAIPGRKI